MESALRLLSRRARSGRELSLRLRQKGFSGEVIEAVLARLKKQGYLDDFLFARQWAGEHWRVRGWGPRRLRAGLLEKGVRREWVEEVVAELTAAIDEQEKAEEILNRRFSQMGPETVEDPKTRRRIFSFLYNRGYSPEAIESALKRFSRRNS